MSQRRPPSIAQVDATTSSGRRSKLVALQDRISLRHVAFLLAVALALAAALYAATAANSYSRRSETTNNFRVVVLALQNYHDTYGYLPKAVVKGTHGEDIWSWRYALTPYLFRTGDFDRRRRDEPWSSPTNRADWMMKGYYFCYPEHGDTTCILAITGPGTVFGDHNDPPYSLDELDSDTILLIETRDSGFVWPQPGDTDIGTLAAHDRNGSPQGLSSIHESGFHIAFADGAVWFIRDDVPFDSLSRFFTVDGARGADRDHDLAQYRLHALWPPN